LSKCKRIKAKIYENEDVLLEISKRDANLLKKISILSTTISLLIYMLVVSLLILRFHPLLNFPKFNVFYILLIIFLLFAATFLGTFLFRFGEIPLTLRASPSRGIVELRLLKPRNREIVKYISIKELSELIVKSSVSQIHIERGGEGNHRVVVLSGGKERKLYKLFVAGPELVRFAERLAEKLSIPLKADFKNVITPSEMCVTEAENDDVNKLKAGEHVTIYVSRPAIYKNVMLAIVFSIFWWLLLILLAYYLIFKGTIPEAVGLFLIIPAVILSILSIKISLKVMPTDRILLKLSGHVLHVFKFLGKTKSREFYVPLSSSYVEEINVLCFGKLQGEPRYWVEIVGEDNIVYIPVTNKNIAVSLAQFLESCRRD